MRRPYDYPENSRGAGPTPPTAWTRDSRPFFAHWRSALFFLLSIPLTSGITFWVLSASQANRSTRQDVYEPILEQVSRFRSASAAPLAPTPLHPRSEESALLPSAIFISTPQQTYSPAHDPALRDARFTLEFGTSLVSGRLAVVEVFFVEPRGGVYPRLFVLRSRDGKWFVHSIERRAGWVDGTVMPGARI